MKKVLVIERELTSRLVIEKLLSAHGIHHKVVDHAGFCSCVFNQYQPTVVILGLHEENTGCIGQDILEWFSTISAIHLITLIDNNISVELMLNVILSAEHAFDRAHSFEDLYRHLSHYFSNEIANDKAYLLAS